MSGLRLRRTAAVVLAFAANAVAAGQGQAPARPKIATGLLAGQVVDADTGRGVPESIVTLTMTAAAGSAPVSPVARDATSRKVITDGNGRFVFTNLAMGRYGLSSTKPGYTSGAPGLTLARGPRPPIDLGDGERVADLRILVWKHAVITGRVTDEAGEPVVGVEVAVLRRASNSGRGGFGNATTVTTDDRGLYRVASLEPGAYIISVPSKATTIPAPLLEAYFRASGNERTEMQQAIFGVTNMISSPGSASNQQIGNQILLVQGRMPTPPMPAEDGTLAIYPTVYYSQAALPGEATPLVMRGGEIKTAVDFVLRPVSGVRVSGTLEGPNGPVGNAAVHLVAPSASSLSSLDSTSRSAIASAVADASGAFAFLGVPPGQYALRVVRLPVAEPRSSPASVVVQTPGGTAARGIGTNPEIVTKQPTYWAEQAVSVGERSVTDVRVAMRTGFRVTGRIAFEAGSAALAVQRFSPFLESADAWLRTPASEAFPAADGSFELPELPGGRYRLTVPTPAGWIVKSAMAGSRDISDLPFELNADLRDVVITLSNRGARLSGVIRDGNGAIAATAGVLLFPADRRQWVDYSAYPSRIKQVTASRNGTYDIPDLLPGEYLLIAAPQAAIDWTDPTLFERLSTLASRVTVTEAEQRTLDLKTVQVR